MKNTMTDLRGHLFDVIENLKNPQSENKMDTKTAEAVCLAAKRLIETAQVELQFREQVGAELTPSNFLELPRSRLSKRRRALEHA